MIACTDVHYSGRYARAGCIVFENWDSSVISSEYICSIEGVNEYVPGRFFERELPCILSVLGRIEENPEVVIIDGYVFLGEKTSPGLGLHLYEALDATMAVVGVAKRRYRTSSAAAEVIRGKSTRPLFVTAVGIPTEEAASLVKSMHGEHRIPTMLRLVDRLCRGVEHKNQSGGIHGI